MRYAHPIPENLQRAVDKLGEIFKTPSRKDVNCSISITLGKLKTSTFLYN